MVFPGVMGEHFKCIDGNQCVGLDCLVCLYLSVPSCLVYPSLYHTKLLPSFKALGRPLFSRKLYFLYLALIPPAVWYLLYGVAADFLFVCVHVFVFPPILGWSWGQALRWNSWALPPAECRTWPPGAGFRGPSSLGSWRTLSRVLINCWSFS